MASLGQNGVIQVVPPAQLELQLQQQATNKALAQQPAQEDVSQLVSYVKGQFEIFRNHRNTSAGWSERLLVALRAFNGQYAPEKLREVRRFGGSEIYARITAQKCRAASSLLRDIYLGPDRCWGLRPSADPKIPDSIVQSINQLMQQEQQMVQKAGQQASGDQVQARKMALLDSAKQAALKKAIGQAQDAEDKLEELLREGGFYTALAEFLVDVSVFPIACIKGPVVKICPQVIWPEGGGPPVVKQVPKLTWQRVSPFDLWWTPGVADIEYANVIEKSRITRIELNDLLDLPGYNHDEIRAVLDEYGRGGLYDNWDTTDAERSVLESRENPAWNRSAMLSMLEFNGCVQGRVLQDYGLVVSDELRDYQVQVWCIGNHVIKAHLSPSPRQRHPYFITSFEKVPGTPVGNSLVDILNDVQESGNATLRALINNMSISSGPQVVVNDDRLSPDENGEDLYPWKRWHVRNDPMSSNSQPPISFFMPSSNAQQLLQVFQAFQSLADDVSAIPKYIGGQAGSGGAGRTASGLAMLMGNASKLLQTVSANIDRDVIEQALMQLVDLVMLTDTTGMLTGEEKVTVQGVNVAIQRETQRQRQIELLQTTNNPTDISIIGHAGRGKMLRSVTRDVGMDGEQIVPPDDQLAAMDEQAKQGKDQGNAQEAIQKGVQSGVEQGVKRIATELAAGGIAAQMNIPEGPPAHIGVQPDQQNPATGGMNGVTNNPSMDLAQAAAHAQGAQPGQIAGNQPGPTTSLVGSSPAGGQMPLAGHGPSAP